MHQILAKIWGAVKTTADNATNLETLALILCALALSACSATKPTVTSLGIASQKGSPITGVDTVVAPSQQKSLYYIFANNAGSSAKVIYADNNVDSFGIASLSARGSNSSQVVKIESINSDDKTSGEANLGAIITQETDANGRDYIKIQAVGSDFKNGQQKLGLTLRNSAAAAGSATLNVDIYLNFVSAHTWTGRVDGDFSKGGNWCGGVELFNCMGNSSAPSTSSAVVIDDTVYHNDATQANSPNSSNISPSLYLKSLSVKNNSLTLPGSLTVMNDGLKIDAGFGTFTMGGNVSTSGGLEIKSGSITNSGGYLFMINSGNVNLNSSLASNSSIKLKFNNGHAISSELTYSSSAGSNVVPINYIKIYNGTVKLLSDIKISELEMFADAVYGVLDMNNKNVIVENNLSMLAGSSIDYFAGIAAGGSATNYLNYKYTSTASVNCYSIETRSSNYGFKRDGVMESTCVHP